MPNRIANLILAVLCLGAPAKADGVELSLSISAQATEVYLGEPLMICVQMTNVSDHDVKVPITWEEGYFSGAVTRQGGKSNKWSFRRLVFLTRHRVVTLRPGESYQRFRGLLRITHYQRPGKYVLDGTFESDGAAPNRITHKSVACWKGSISAKPLKIEVKKSPRKSDREILEMLSAPYGGVEKCAYFENIWNVGMHSLRMCEGKDRRYQTVLEKYPDSVYAPYCRFGMAWHHLDQYDGLGGGYKKAVEYLDTLLKMDPPFHWAAEAELTLARAHLAEAEHSRTAKPPERKALREKAALQLRHILRKYPTLPTAEESTRLLKSLGADAQDPTSIPAPKGSNKGESDKGESGQRDARRATASDTATTRRSTTWDSE
ncbi:MAG: hypothetical protein H8E53_00520 [Planctomycetes bacterium]|nr:hypothetical protein [Planctomycetota bacterium]